MATTGKFSATETLSFTLLDVSMVSIDKSLPSTCKISEKLLEQFREEFESSTRLRGASQPPNASFPGLRFQIYCLFECLVVQMLQMDDEHQFESWPSQKYQLSCGNNLLIPVVP